MKQNLINDVIQAMLPYLNNSQAEKLQEVMQHSPTQSTGRCTAISESLLNRYDSGMVCTNFCRALKPIDGYSMFIYYYWQYLYDKGIFFSYENGTTGIKIKYDLCLLF